MSNEESVFILSFGISTWRNKDGKLHRIDGPAVILPTGTKMWYLNGNLYADKQSFFESLTDLQKERALFSRDFYE